MAGVGILAYDLLPDYGLYKARRDIESAEEELKNYRHLVQRKPKTGADDAIERHREFLVESSRLIVNAGILLAGGRLKIPVRPPSQREQVNYIKWADQKILKLKRTCNQRRWQERSRRPPITVGIFFIILGFALQIVGAAPWGP